MSGSVSAAAMLAGSLAMAQDAPPMPRPADLVDVAVPIGGGYSASELDALLAPVALYPDALLTQILVAATAPLDLVKADRWIAENAGLAADARAAAAEAEGWDPSVAVLAAGFPDVVTRMAADLDGTEALGDAVLAQTDDVLASVQRLRAQAQAAGALASTAQQTVTVDEGAISIAPADPEVVYVPSYDPAVVYAAPVGTAYATTTPVYGDGYDSTDLLMTGAIAFGGALLIDEIFEDDDDWNGYWGPDDVHIDWDDGDFYPRPDIDIEGDVNIDRDIDRDRVVIDGDRGPIDADRAEAARERIGARDPDRPGAWTPDPERQQSARAKIENRPGAEGRERASAAAALGAGGAGAAAAGSGAARAKLEAASAGRTPGAGRASYDNTFKPQVSGGGASAKAARDRGAASAGAPRAKSAANSHPKAISKTKQARPPTKRAAPKSSALKKQSGGASRARASSSRGGKSASRGGGGGRRR